MNQRSFTHSVARPRLLGSLGRTAWRTLRPPPTLPEPRGSRRPRQARCSPTCQDVNSWRTPEFNPPGGTGPTEPQPAAPNPQAPPGPQAPRRKNKKKKTFEERYQELTRFYLQHGHCLVPVAEPAGLGGWVTYQRRLWKAGQLPLEHYHALAALGFQFDAFEARWAARFRQLSAFHSQYGHTSVPPDSATEAQWPGLRQWSIVQRVLWKRGLLADERARRLSGLGFVWEPEEARWEELFEELKAFKEEHGHCNVPKGWQYNRGLASWVERIRCSWRARQGQRPLSASREARLRELGFEFDPQRRSWEERCGQLQELRARRGHLAGPFPSKGRWAGLAEWVAQQRHKWRAGRLPPDRERELGELGFVWDPEEAAWAARLQAVDGLVERLGPQMAWALLEGSLQSRQWAKAEGRLAATGLPAQSSGRRPSAAQHAALNDASGQWDLAAEALLVDEGEAEGQAPLPARRPPARRQDQASSGSGLSEPGRATQQIRANAELQALVRWYANVRRAAARGELRPERVQQLQERGGLR